MAHLTLVPLQGLLREQRALAALLAEVERLRALNRRFAQAVTPPIARTCRVVALREGEALVYCSHGTAAARLRVQAATVARALGGGVRALRVKVRADWAVPPPRAKKAGIGPKGLAAWEALEAELRDEDLKAAVARLIRHQRLGSSRR